MDHQPDTTPTETPAPTEPTPKINKKKIMVISAMILGLLILGIIGWFVWQNSNNTQTDDTHQSQQSATQDNPAESNNIPPSNPAESDPSEGGKYLVIKEWHVKILLSPDIARAYYVIDDQGDDEFVRLYDAALDEMKNADGETCDGTKAHNIFVIGRTPKASLYGEWGEEYRNHGFKEYDFSSDFAFSGVGYSQAPPLCSILKSGEFDENIENTALAKRQLFTEAFRSFQAE